MKNAIEAHFDAWFDGQFPADHFGSSMGTLRESFKNDIAKKAYKQGLILGLAAVHDTDWNVLIHDYVKD